MNEKREGAQVAMTLEEYLDQSAEAWFPTGKKRYG